MKEFKIRCSDIGKIMTKPKLKTENLSSGAKTYCQKWLIEQLTGKKRLVFADTLYKGNECESDAIDMISSYFNWGFVLKNEKHFDSDYITGTPDIILPELIVDIKCPIDHEAMPYFENDPDKDYFYQGQGYMNLTGIHDYKLVYCLMNAPEKLIDSKIRQMKYFSDADVIDEFFMSENMKYDDLPMKLRIKSFDFNYDDSIAIEIIEKVKYCREYIKELIKKNDL